VRSFAQFALTISLAAALLVGCGGSQSAISASGAMPQTPASAPTGIVARRSVPRSSYRVLYSFAGGSDGAYPAAALIDVNGTLYGTTSQGGGSGCKYHIYQIAGCGTVFAVTTSGTEKVLYSFRGLYDGWNPQAGLVDVNGTLYGTTAALFNGCDYILGCGTVYSVSLSGTEKVLYGFGNGSTYSGFYPVAGLIDVKGVLYSTTDGGGARYPYGKGTVFSVTISGQENVLHSFAGGSDGAFPQAGLVDVKDVLYGTTVNGGSAGGGVVFNITPAGVEKVLHSFAGPPDGSEPSSAPINVKGILYGTTTYGGQHYQCNVGTQNSGCGTVYRVSATGAEMVIYSFAGLSDGAVPVAGLTELNGALYGTTQYGGTSPGGGTVFKISASGRESVLHRFGKTRGDGANPVASLIDVNGTLYGTTYSGGRHKKGTVFALTP
jgi:uncharacterized repeat protein (TIGR03803 family)